MNAPRKTYLIEDSSGALITSGLTSKEAAAFLNVPTQHLPPLNTSATIHGYHVEAFPEKDEDDSNA